MDDRPLPMIQLPYPATRVGDTDRTSACDQLCEHYAAGRLSADELDDRLAAAVAARTRHDLQVLLHDLGPLRPPAQPPQPATSVAPAPRRWSVSVVLAVMVLVGCFLLAGGMLVLLGSVDVGLFLAAAVGGTAAAVGGACGAYVVGWWAAAARRGHGAACPRS